MLEEVGGPAQVHKQGLPLGQVGQGERGYGASGGKGGALSSDRLVDTRDDWSSRMPKYERVRSLPS